jgi:gallate dioxygenase
MARIIGGIGASHTPTIGFAKDKKRAEDPDWAGVFKLFEPLQDWLRESNPDALVYIYNDHVTSFFFDHYSPFVLGVDDQYVTADEGGGPREHPPVLGNAKLARHIASSLFADELPRACRPLSGPAVPCGCVPSSVPPAMSFLAPAAACRCA